jgi:ABC-2 type transport system ATP-binding protein
MIHHGREVLLGGLQEIKGKYKEHTVRVDVAGDIGILDGVIHRKVNKGLVELELSPETTPQHIMDQLHEKDMAINHFEIKEPSLHEIFLHLAGNKHE